MKELIYHRGFLPAVQKFGNNLCVVDKEYKATYAEHANRVFRLIHALKHQLGITRDKRFAVLGLTCHEFFELYHAAFLGAGIINPLNTRLSEKELAYIIDDSGAEIIFVDQHFVRIVDKIRQSSDGECSIRQVVLMGQGNDPCDFHYEDLLASAEAEVPDEPDEEDVAALMYTGGTTGMPKGVVHTQRSEILNCYHSIMTLPVFGPDETYLLQTPIFHAASIIPVLSNSMFGGVLVLIPKFEPAKVIELIETYNVTTTNMVPTMITMLLNSPDFQPERIRNLKSLSYGASPMPINLLDRLFEMLPHLELIQGYGMTEAGSLLTILKAEDHRSPGPRLRSVGEAVLGTVISIQDDKDQFLANGEIGEICAKGGNYMTGYWNKQAETEDAFRNGWYHTGDAGYLDDDGYLFLVDRVKDMIISGGENIYSAEVENAILSCPGVNQTAVIGIPHDTWGEAVHAIVVPVEGVALTEAEIIEHTRSSIAGYKVPKSIEFRTDPLPLSGVLKVLKRELREPYWQGIEKT